MPEITSSSMRELPRSIYRFPFACQVSLNNLKPRAGSFVLWSEEPSAVEGNRFD
jgi:hypothetical protein